MLMMSLNSRGVVQGARFYLIEFNNKGVLCKEAKAPLGRMAKAGMPSNTTISIRRLSPLASLSPPPPPPPPPPTQEDSNRKSFFPKRGQTVELVCQSLGFKGKGVCKVDDTGFVLLCDRALPGERFLGRVTRRKGNYAEVTKIKTLSPHWDSVDAPCEYSSYCGGCKMQNLLYEAQLRAKEEQVRDLLVHVGRFSDKSIMKPIVPCANQFHYRNKMEFSFSAKKWVPQEILEGEHHFGNDYALGLHAPGFFDKVLNIDKCLLQSQPANAVLLAVQDCWRDSGLNLDPYDVHSHAGFLKHLVLRTGRNIQNGKPELMVNFVTSSYKPELLKPLVKNVSAVPEVVSIVNNTNTSVGSTSIGEEEHILYGKSTITEVLRGLSFQISANSFFQTNTEQAEVLYKLIEDQAGLEGDGSEIVLDLFCGTGTIGLTLAKRISTRNQTLHEARGSSTLLFEPIPQEASYISYSICSILINFALILCVLCCISRVRHVYGYEVVAQAISDAQRNAELNGICNATFIQGDLNKIDENFGKNLPRPDIVISDPNRPGMHMKLIKFLLKLKAPRIVYVSCNPATFARDLNYLCHGLEEQNIQGCYKLRSVQPVDMFPHTPHIECVCLLEFAGTC